MSRLITKSLLVAVFSLATAAVGFAQRQPATSGGTSGAATAERNRQTKDTNTNGSTKDSANSATTAADRSGKSTSAKATFEVYKDKGGEYRWRLRANNTQIIAMAAQGYSDKRSCLNAIESVKRDVANAPVEEKEAVAGKDDASTDGAAAKTAGSRSSDSSATGKTGSTTGSKSSQK